MYLGNVDGAQCHAILDCRFWILDCGLKQQPVGIRVGIRIRIRIKIKIRIKGSPRDRPLLWYIGNVDGP